MAHVPQMGKKKSY